MTQLTRGISTSGLQLAVAATNAAISDAGLEVSDIDGMVRYSDDEVTELALASTLGIRNLRYFGEVGYGGSAHAAVVGQAAMAVSMGLADTVLCYRQIRSWSGRRPGDGVQSQTLRGSAAFVAGVGSVTPSQTFALFAQRYLSESGATTDDFGRVAVHHRLHGSRNPGGLYFQRPLTIAEYKQSPMIVDPLRARDCAVQSDGAAAVVVTSRSKARTLTQHPVFVRAFSQGTGSNTDGIVFRDELSRSDDAEAAASDLYNRASLGPGDMDVALLYDHFSPLVLIALEAYGFANARQGHELVRSGATLWPDGRIPVNTHGGHLAEGYLQGMGHVVEAVRQLRHAAPLQVDDAQFALVGSAIAQVASAMILERA